MSDAYESFLRRLDSYEDVTDADRAAQYGYAMALYDFLHITLDELEALRKRIGLDVDASDDLQV